MSNTDKKIVSILLLCIMIISILMPTLTFAAVNDEIIKDSKLKDELIRLGVDSNNDKIITKQEIEKYKTSYMNIPEGVKDLTGLEYIQDLEYISMYYNDKDMNFGKIIDKITEICINFKEKDQQANYDFNFLKKFKNLKSVEIYGGYTSNEPNRNFNLGVLNEIKTLERILITNINGEVNVKDIKDCINVKDLEIIAKNIDFAGISNFNKLNNLRIERAEEIKNIKEIEKLTTLKEVSIYNSKPLDLSIVRNSKQLESIYYYGGNVSKTIDLYCLKDLQQLEYININSATIKNINVISTLKNLKQLYMYGVLFSQVDDYKNVKFNDYTAYLGETGQLRDCEYLGHKITFASSSYKAANNNLVDLKDNGHFKANDLGETEVSVNINNQVTKKFKIKVNGISANQAIGNKMKSNFTDAQTVLKANGDLYRVYAKDEKAVKLNTNVQKYVYERIYDYENERIFPYSLTLKKDGMVEYEFNGIKSTISDAKDIYNTGYLTNDGTYLEIQSDGTWKKVTDNVEKIVGSFIVKKDQKTYTINNKLVCNFPIKIATYSSVVDTSNRVWKVYTEAPIVQVGENFDSLVNDYVYKDKSGVYRDMSSGKEVTDLYSYSYWNGISLKKDGNLYLNDKLVLTKVTNIVSYSSDDRSTYYDSVIYMITREDASIWLLSLAGEGSLVKVQETESSFAKKGALTEKIVGYENTLSGFSFKNLSIENVFKGKLQDGYTVKVFDGEKQLTAKDKLFTGATIEIYNAKGKKVGTYTALVYGDVQGKGAPGVKDALTIVKYKMGNDMKLSTLQLEAARVTPKTRKTAGEPSTADALAIVKAKLGKYNIQ